jgi:hypothetical protein
VLEAPPGLAIDWIAQDAPFQDSASAVGGPPLARVVPTASQAALEAQEISLMVALITPAGSGIDTSFQAVPFHVSAKGEEPVVVFMKPMATQFVVDVHETRERRLNVPPDGLGVGWTLQLVPFQTSASVPDWEAPTAVQADDEVHDTPAKPAVDPPAAG